MATKRDLQPHIYHPLPKTLLKDLKDHPKQPQSKEERLRTIMSNLETHHCAVRNRLISRAKAKNLALRTQQQIQSSSTDTGLSSTSPSPSQQSALDLLHANLLAPYIEGSGDPCTPLPAPPPEVRQATPPPEIEICKEVLDQIELYDKHAKPTREYYERALARLMQGRRGSSSAG